MSNKRIPKVVRYSRKRLPRDKTDWARVHAMTDAEVLSAARSDPDAQPLAPQQLARMRRVSPYFAKRAARADFAAFDRLMKRRGGEPPQPDDRIPESYRKKRPRSRRT
jgi:hypothetical protein